MKYRFALAVGLAFILYLGSSDLEAQNNTFHGWFFSSHEQSVTKKITLLSDIQVRSAKQLGFMETLLLRPGVQYEINKQQNAAVGFAYLANWEELQGLRSFEKELRIWEQYALKRNIKNTEITNRVQLEQRLLEEGFAQRIRYYIRGQIPLKKTGTI